MKFGGLLVMVLALLWASPAWAQPREGKDAKKGEIKTYTLPSQPETPKTPFSTRKGGPLSVRTLKFHGEAMADEKLEEAIATLNQLIETTDDEDEAKPEYLQRLADLYWDKAENFFNKAYGDEMFKRLKAAQDANDEAGVAAVQADQQELLKQRTYWQEETAKVYRQLADLFPNYKNIDAVLYYLGFTLVQLDRQAEAYPFFIRIVKERPTSQYVHDALLNIGEYHFNLGQMEDASKIYSEVENFPESQAYGLAIYKKGWCLYNMGMHEEAMNQFLKVIDYARSDAAKVIGYGPQLLREAQRDLVMVYSRVGSPENAITVFKKISPNGYMDLAVRLAEGYTSQGEYDKSTKVYKKIIAEIKDTPEQYKVVEYQRGILENAYKIGVKAKVGEEASRLIGVLDKFKDTGDKKFMEAELDRTEELVRVIATMYHKEVAITQEEATMEITVRLYDEYFRLFPNSAERYNMLMNHAKLAYQLGKYDTAAERFSQVAEMDPQGEHGIQAAHDAVSSYHKLVEARAKAAAKSEDTADLEPKELPPFEQKLVAACDRYVKMAGPDAPDIVQARFAAAMVLYQFNHFKEAAEGFRAIIEKWPEDTNAPDAARLLLSTYHLMRDIKGLNETADIVSRDPRLMQGEVPTIVNRIREQADFNKCYSHEQAGKYSIAGDCFLAYVKNFPQTPLKDRAYINAANNFFRARQVERSLQANTTLFNEMPNSPLAARALFNVGEIYRRLAVYSEAARFYETFVKLLPKHELTEEALRYATIFRSGLGEYDAAIADLNQYLKLFPNAEHAPSVYMEIGSILEKQGKYAAAQKQFESYLAKYGKSGGLDLMLKAYLKIATMLKKQKKDDAAMAAYRRTVTAYNTLTDEEKAKVTAAGLAFAAEARFQDGEAVLAEVREIKLKLPENVLQDLLNKKLKKIKEAMDIYASVEAFQQPHWTIAAYSRKGFGFQELASAIETAPVPPELNEDQKALWSQKMQDRAQPIWEKAKDEFKRCIETAQKLKWYNEFSAEAEEAILKLDPSFRVLSDIRPQPGALTLNAGRPNLQPEKEDAEAPQWEDPDLFAKVKASAEAKGASGLAYYNYGVVLEAKGDRAGARAAYEKAFAADAKLASAVARIGSIELAEGRLDRATAQFEKALQIDPANSVAHNWYAARSLGERKFAEAVDHARMALVDDPDSMDAYLNLAATYLQMNLIDVGVLVCRNAIGLQPKDAPIQNILGLLMLKLGEVRAAVRLFEKAATDDPGLFDAHFNFAAVTLAYKDYDSAAAQFEKALTLRPKDLQAQMGLAIAYRGQGKGEEALKLLDAIAAATPNNPDVAFNKCLLFQETLNQDEKALAACQQFLNQAPSNHPKRKEAERRIDGIKATIEAMKQVNTQ